MNSRSNVFKMLVIALGGFCLLAALFAMSFEKIGWGFLVIVALGVFVGPRMSFILPRSKFAVSFSDALIFLSFLLYGGEAAIVIASVGMLAECLRIRKQGFHFGPHMILWNASLHALSTSITFLIWLSLPHIFGVSLDVSKTPQLITLLGILALAQFLTSSIIAGAFQSVRENEEFWVTWTKDCFSSSMTQIVGAAIAGIFFKLITYGDVMTAVISSAAIGIAYFSYRQSVEEVNRAVANVELAERERAETERERRLEAEKHADELLQSLQKEERANVALRKSEQDFQHAALHDSLTGLANRKKFGDILRKLILEYRDDPSQNFQVLFVDIRSFKQINDTLGHTIGDKVLAIAAKRFVRLLNPNDTVARIGGDEFAIILRDLATVGKAQKVARRIYESITQPFSLSGNNIRIDMNIGIAPCDAEYDTPEQILRDADIAMHYAKESGTGLGVFTKELRARFLKRFRFEMDLRHALERDELSMHYQPIVSLAEGRIIGFEALLRWHHSEFGLIPPVTFIPIAEESGLIQPITVWILQETTKQLAAWQKISSEYKDLLVSINISGKHLSNDDLFDDVDLALQMSGIRPSTLKLEITESTTMENPENTVNVLRKLKRIGVQLSIDDFGTGYSSLSYLQRLPFDTLKIDRSFVSGVGSNGENSELLQTIISLAKNLKMRVIAEGIETESQLAVLQTLGCDYGQGYLMARPKPLDETEKLLYSHKNLLPESVYSESYEQYRDAIAESLPIF